MYFGASALAFLVCLHMSSEALLSRAAGLYWIPIWNSSSFVHCVPQVLPQFDCLRSWGNIQLHGMLIPVLGHPEVWHSLPSGSPFLLDSSNAQTLSPFRFCGDLNPPGIVPSLFFIAIVGRMGKKYPFSVPMDSVGCLPPLRWWTNCRCCPRRLSLLSCQPLLCEEGWLPTYLVVLLLSPAWGVGF